MEIAGSDQIELPWEAFFGQSCHQIAQVVVAAQAPRGRWRRSTATQAAGHRRGEREEERYQRPWQQMEHDGAPNRVLLRCTRIGRSGCGKRRLVRSFGGDRSDFPMPYSFEPQDARSPASQAEWFPREHFPTTVEASLRRDAKIINEWLSAR